MSKIFKYIYFHQKLCEIQFLHYFIQLPFFLFFLARGATESEKVKMNEEIFKDIIKEDLKRNTSLTGTKIQEILEKKNPEIPINLVKNKVPKTKFMKTSRK